MSGEILKLFIVRDALIAQRAADFILTHWQQYVEDEDPLAVQIVPAEAPRTTQQNRFYWGVLLAYIAEHAWVLGWQYSALQWHELFKRMFIGCLDLPNGEVVGMSSTKLSIKKFNRFMRRIEAYAVTELGIDFNGELDDWFVQLQGEEDASDTDDEEAPQQEPRARQRALP